VRDCPDRDETGECIRRYTRCSCNPPRCYVCGRYMKDWAGPCTAECEAAIEFDRTEEGRKIEMGWV
jgi:hypothetical protein